MNLLTAFVLGLAGSLHCAVMCGPLVFAVNAARRRNQVNPATRFFSGDILHNFAYHGGRILTYSLLGAISGLIGAALVFAGFQRWISITAGGLVLLGALTSFGVRWGSLPGLIVSVANTRFSRLLRDRTLGAVVLMGGLNGFLPCGLVYIACAAAGTSGGVGGGVATMLAFGLGTAPIMLSVSLAGRVIRWTHPVALHRVVLVCATVAGVLLIVRGLSLGIPYISPLFLDGRGPSCPCLSTWH